MSEQLERIPAEEKDLTYKLHALPDNWQHMDYYDFLEARRPMMARVIRQAFRKLSYRQVERDAKLEKLAGKESDNSV